MTVRSSSKTASGLGGPPAKVQAVKGRKGLRSKIGGNWGSWMGPSGGAVKTTCSRFHGVFDLTPTGAEELFALAGRSTAEKRRGLRNLAKLRRDHIGFRRFNRFICFPSWNVL